MHHIDTVKVTVGSGRNARIFMLPLSQRRQVEKFIAAHSDDDSEDLVPAEVVFPELLDPIMGPAMSLRGSRHKADMTQKELAKKMKLKQHHLSEMEHGKRPIGKKMAQRLAKALKCDYRVFL